MKAFGFLTMAASADAVVRASALGRSLAAWEPKTPVALIVVDPTLEVPPGIFAEVIRVAKPEPFEGELRFLNKLYQTIRRSPFRHTFFLDDDTLVIGPLQPLIESRFASFPVAINTRMEERREHATMNHLVPSRVIEEFGVSACRNVYGGGHMFFSDDAAAREILEASIQLVLERRDLYTRLAGQSVISDELALMVIANERGLPMPEIDDFVDAFSLWQANQIAFDTIAGTYRWPQRHWGRRIEDVRVLHFCSRGKRSLPYRKEIHRLTGLRQSFDEGPTGFARRVSMSLRNELRRGRRS